MPALTKSSFMPVSILSYNACAAGCFAMTITSKPDLVLLNNGLMALYIILLNLFLPTAVLAILFGATAEIFVEPSMFNTLIIKRGE